MFVVIHESYGLFYVPGEVQALIGCGPYDNEMTIRTNPIFVDWVAKNNTGSLVVVEMPNTATDYYITEYDGMERLLYVLNGKIHWAENAFSNDF